MLGAISAGMGIVSSVFGMFQSSKSQKWMEEQAARQKILDLLAADKLSEALPSFDTAKDELTSAADQMDLAVTEQETAIESSKSSAAAMKAAAEKQKLVSDQYEAAHELQLEMAVHMTEMIELQEVAAKNEELAIIEQKKVAGMELSAAEHLQLAAKEEEKAAVNLAKKADTLTESLKYHENASAVAKAAAGKALELGQLKANIEKANMDETIRRHTEESDRKQSLAVARSGASGIGGESAKLYVSDMVETAAKEMAWMSEVGQSKYDVAIQEGKSASDRAMAEYWGSKSAEESVRGQRFDVLGDAEQLMSKYYGTLSAADQATGRAYESMSASERAMSDYYNTLSNIEGTKVEALQADVAAEDTLGKKYSSEAEAEGSMSQYWDAMTRLSNQQSGVYQTRAQAFQTRAEAVGMDISKKGVEAQIEGLGGSGGPSGDDWRSLGYQTEDQWVETLTDDERTVRDNAEQLEKDRISQITP